MNTSTDEKVLALFNALTPAAKAYILAKLVDMAEFLPVASDNDFSDVVPNIKEMH